jgi:hypothetical protein
MFPSLPDDPPHPETIGILLLLILTICTVSVIMRIVLRVKNPIRPFAKVVTLLLIGLLWIAVTIGARNFGQWNQLKQELIAYSIDVQDYTAKHGLINSQDKVDAFYSEHPAREFTFDNGAKKVYLVYLWWTKPNLVGIAWGSAHAAFDLDTMICIYSD